MVIQVWSQNIGYAMYLHKFENKKGNLRHIVFAYLLVYVMVELWLNVFFFLNLRPSCQQIMYLRAADNNRSETNLAFFQEAVQEFGYPLR